MQGYSGTYAFNGVNIMPPSESKWNTRDNLGYDGSGHPIYPAIRSYEMSWELISTSDLQQLINAQLATASTGTMVVDLPKWGDAGYLFYSYTGCIINEPEVGAYFAGYSKDVHLVITNVRTN